MASTSSPLCNNNICAKKLKCKRHFSNDLTGKRGRMKNYGCWESEYAFFIEIETPQQMRERMAEERREQYHDQHI